MYTLNKRECIKNLEIFSFGIILCLYQVFFLAHYGFSLSDPGYLFGLGYRILQGQEMYVDFLYARPPLSPYLAAFWMYVLPEDGAFYYTKVIVYIYNFLSALMIFFILKNNLTSFFKKVNEPLLFLLIMVFGISNLNHFWHTSDGIFFSVMAIYLLTSSRKLSKARVVVASGIIVLAMLTKQSFYPMPFYIALFIALNYSFKKSILFILSTLAWLSSFLIFAYAYHYESLMAFINFKQSVSQVGPLVVTGVISYVLALLMFLFTFVPLINIYLFGTIRKLRIKKNYRKIYKLTVLHLFCIFILLLSVFKTLEVIEVANSFSNLLLQAGIAFSIVWYIIEFQRKKQTNKEVNLLLLMLMIGWCASLSWGFKSPILHSSTIFIFMMYVHFIYTKKHINGFLIFYIIAVFVLLDNIAIMNKYISPSKDLGKISKKLNYLLTNNEQMFDRMLKIENEITKCKGLDYTVIPSNPHIHWIHNSSPQTSLDWISNVEMLNQKEKVMKELRKTPCVITDTGYLLRGHDKFDFNRTALPN